MWNDVEPSRTGRTSFESNESCRVEKRICQECTKGGMQSENEIESPARGQLFDQAVYTRPMVQEFGL